MLHIRFQMPIQRQATENNPQKQRKSGSYNLHFTRVVREWWAMQTAHYIRQASQKLIYLYISIHFSLCYNRQSLISRYAVGIICRQLQGVSSPYCCHGKFHQTKTLLYKQFVKLNRQVKAVHKCAWQYDYVGY